MKTKFNFDHEGKKVEVEVKWSVPVQLDDIELSVRIDGVEVDADELEGDLHDEVFNRSMDVVSEKSYWEFREPR